MTGYRQQKPRNGLTKCPDLVDRYTHNRKEQKERDKKLYKARHPVENSFLHLKQWKRIATRYTKNTSSFVAAVQFRSACICGPPSHDDSLYSKCSTEKINKPKW